jgi:hypothetical protein
MEHKAGCQKFQIALIQAEKHERLISKKEAQALAKTERREEIVR